VKYQVILYNTGAIKIQYNNIVLAGGAPMGTVGIQNAAATTYLQYRCQSAGNTVMPLAAGRAIWFYLPPPEAHDFGTQGFVSPVGPNVNGGSVFPVTVNVKNFGTSTEGSPIKYQFNGGAIQSETVAALAPNATTTHTFAASITVPNVPGSYVLKSWTDLATDSYRGNDTSTVTLNVVPESCAGAQNVALVPLGRAQVSGNTTGSVADCPDTCTMNNGYISSGPDHFYSITLTECRRITMSLTGGDMHLVIYPMGVCCGSPYLCNDDDAGFTPVPSWDSTSQHAGGTASYLAAELGAGTWYIKVAYYSSGSGAYTLNVYDNGPCPLSGRCCYGDPYAPTCAVNSSSDCATLGGTWSGGLDCSLACPAIPANDSCAHAQVATVNGPAVTGNSTNATRDCASYVYAAEVWETFTTTECMDVTISMCGSVPAMTSYVGYLFTDCPCGGTATYRTAANTTTCPDGNPTQTWSALPAGTYYYAIYGASSYWQGNYSMTVTGLACPPPPVNDNCADATPIAIGGTISGDSRGSTVDCPAVGYAECWSKFTLEQCSDVVIDFCGTSPNLYTVYSSYVYNACPCGTGIYRTTADLTTCTDGNATIRFRLQAGTYYYPIIGSSATFAGPYRMTLNATACPPPPANDLCANAITLPIPGSATGNTTDASLDVTGTCVTTTTAPGIWYKVTGNGDILKADLCATSPAWDSKLSVFCGHCDSLVCVTGNDDDYTHCGNALSWVSWCSAPATDYFILVHGFNTNVGAFTLNVTDSLVACTTPVACIDIPCDLAIPGNAVPENEPCGTDINGGCNSTTPIYSPIACGEWIHGTAQVVGNVRDTDWYQIVNNADSAIYTFRMVAKFPAQALIVDGNNGCPTAGPTIISSATGLKCDTVTVVSPVLVPGTYWFWAGPSSYLTDFACTDYVAQLTCQIIDNPCIKPDSLTVLLSLGGTHTWLHFRAHEIGRYVIYESTNKNNDGDPRGGDPQFTARDTITTVAQNTTVSWTDNTVVGNYKNYSVLCIDCTPPPPVGRCCYGDPLAPSCANNTQAQCNALSGTWNGATTCELTACPIQGAGENCTSAIVISAPGTFTGDNTTYTMDTPAMTCGSGGYADTWYTYTPLSAGSVTAATCTGTGYDTILQVYTGACGTLTSVGCSDDGCSVQSTVTWTATAGTTYSIRVASYYVDDLGPFTLTVTGP
jgi:hypothetical protein